MTHYGKEQRLTSGVTATEACRLHTQHGTKLLCRWPTRNKKKRPKEKSEHSNKNKTPAEADK